MNIAVVRTDKLGDFITALPACKVLKNYDKNNKIYVCVSSMNAPLARECDFIDGVIIDDGCNVFELSRRLKEFKVDVSITLFSNTRVAVAQFLAGIKIRIAPATKIAQIFYNKRIKQRRSEVKMAEFEYNLELTKILFPDINTNYEKPLLRFDDADVIYQKFCADNRIEKDIVAFHVGFGGSSDANWSLDEYEILIREVLHVNKYQVVLSFGPDEKILQSQMQQRLRDTSAVFYLSNEGIVGFAKLIVNFKLFVSTSTGTYHLASLIGTPTMTFFGDSKFASAARWRAVGDEVLQKYYMLPQEEEKRKEIFEKVKKELSTF